MAKKEKNKKKEIVSYTLLFASLIILVIMLVKANSLFFMYPIEKDSKNSEVANLFSYHTKEKFKVSHFTVFNLFGISRVKAEVTINGIPTTVKGKFKYKGITLNKEMKSYKIIK